MRNYSCIIIDDEEIARDLLENFIGRIPHVELLGKYGNPLEAISSIRVETVDLVFLDIQMPSMTGIEFLKTLSRTPAIIFTTAYDQYALEGYQLSVIDYLLKPFSFTRFMQAVNKATELIELKDNAKSEIIAKIPSTSQTPLEYLLINADHKLHRIYFKDILYIQSMKEYVSYVTDQGKVMAWGSLKSLEEKLPSADFMRIHKSYIVAKNRVNSLNGNQLELGDIILPIGGSYRDDVLEKLFDKPKG
ncbi:MAG: response regulator transcription factor [Bacteroidia bacterium]|nr:response regulator transcription factor [Bacteroidia bacterium]